MKGFSRPIFIGLFLFMIWTSACTAATPPSATPVGTILVDESLLAIETIEPGGTPVMPIIPITGENVVEMQCQFCVNDRTHAVFIFPEFAIFDVEASTPVTCLTAEVINGKRVLVCNGAQLSTFNLKICSDSSNCLLFPVVLQGCPLAGAPGAPFSTPGSPVFLTPIHTLQPPRDDPNGATQAATQVNSEPPLQPTFTDVAAPTNIPPTNMPPPTQGGGGEEGGDLVICHIPPGNPSQQKTMTVSQSAWENEHSKHGDSLGACS